MARYCMDDRRLNESNLSKGKSCAVREVTMIDDGELLCFDKTVEATREETEAEVLRSTLEGLISNPVCQCLSCLWLKHPCLR